MTLLLYAIADEDHPVPAGTRGLDGHALRTVRDGGDPVALVADGPEELRPSADRLGEYERTVDALQADRSLLARFGTMFGGDAAVAAALGVHLDALADRLRHVRGAVEFGVRASAPEPPDAAAHGGDPPTGTAYLVGRLEARRRASALLAPIDAELADLVRDRAPRIRGGGEVATAYLVDCERTGDFVQRCRDAEPRLAPATIPRRSSGGWPSWS